MLSSKAKGDEVENELVEHLTQICGLQAQKNLIYSMRYSHDVEAYMNDKDRLTFECKNDLYAEKSGNIAIEHFNSKKNEPSGILVSQSDIWVHKACGTIWVCATVRLKKFFETEKPHKKIKSGGDKNANLHLYKIDHFTSICKPLGEFTCLEDFVALLS